MGRKALAGLYVFTVTAVAGYAVFGRDPARVAALPGPLAEVYPWAFAFFAQGHVWLTAAVLGTVLRARAGWRWLPALALLYTTSLAAELMGTGYGVPFGAYRYSAALGPMWLGRVPVVIPLSWFCMAIPSYALARRAYPGRSARAGRIFLASLILMSWDLSLDPAMSHATRYWIWADTGPYYGMPWLNLVGWYATGLVLMGILAAMDADRWVRQVPIRWLAAFYGANLLLPLGMNLAAGLTGAAAATAVALAAATGWAATARRRQADRAVVSAVEAA